jgi:hypothetical protein
LDTHGLPVDVTGLAVGFPASELVTELALQFQLDAADAALASAADARSAIRTPPDHVSRRISSPYDC